MKYTAMYGDQVGFYESIDAENDDEAVEKSLAYMKTETYRVMANQYEGDKGFTDMLYQVLTGDWRDNQSQRIIWDYFNGRLLYT
jgi:hypothetical protein